MGEKVSIIVPIYNSEKCIKQCISSIQNQTYKNLEIILIDDGSTDSSLDICRSYAAADERIKVIHKENGGVSSARNCGIRAASGVYIQFVDSDDTVDKNMTNILVQHIEKENADIVISSYITERWGRTQKHICPNRVYANPQEMKIDFELLYLDCFLNSPWNKLFRRDKIIHYFDESMHYFEDYIFNLNYISNISRIVTIDQCLYKYKEDSNNSLTKVYREDLREVYIKVYNEQMKFCHNYFSTTYDHYISFSLVLGTYMSLQKLVYFSNKSRKEKIAEIKKWINNPVIKKSLTKEIFLKRHLKDVWQILVFYCMAKINGNMLIFYWFTIKEKMNIFRIKWKKSNLSRKENK